MSPHERRYAETVKNSAPIAGRQYGYEALQPDIENCSNGVEPQPNTVADGSRKMIVPVVVSMTRFLFDHYRLNMYSYLNGSLHSGRLKRIIGFPFTNRIINREVCDFRGVTYVRQVIENLEPAMDLPGGVYNFGSGNAENMVCTARQFAKALGITVKIAEESWERNLVMDAAKLERSGIRFAATQQGIRCCLQDYGLSDL